MIKRIVTAVNPFEAETGDGWRATFVKTDAPAVTWILSPPDATTRPPSQEDPMGHKVALSFEDGVTKVISIDGDVLGILSFGAAGILWMLVPFWDRASARGEKNRNLTYAGLFIVLFMIVMTIIGWLT